MTDDYYSEFLGIDGQKEESDKLDIDKDIEWIKLHPTAKEAFEAINSLKKEKMRYISGHHSKQSYKTLSLWTISKAEVARRVDKAPQPLFNSNTYSEKLSNYYNDANEVLINFKEKRLKTRSKGYQHKSKEELKISTIKLTKENEQLLQKNCEKLFEKMLNKLPFDIKQKLGLS
ncbi:hypothetical protein L0668_19865 [Paraglaciecola aquimarina]|uniref:Uncharacterized protein n=1 Tax=Paraglaciecola algarum TaxID=3050085 RepID=A0ABS9DC08_9ALTE|nr:hypothetical protein [Paraglaciecola sp. G1-23]MCF2950376.1 hypothetical protein [Paraglaciecola sp. G1-23]